MRSGKAVRRILPGPTLLLIASVGGGAIVASILAKEILACAGPSGHWATRLTLAAWVNLGFHIAVLSGLSILISIGLSVLSRGVRGGRYVAFVASLSVGVTAWLIPSLMIMNAAYALGSTACSDEHFWAILLLESCAVCGAIASILSIFVMAIFSAWRRSRTGGG